ncbi:MAG: glutamate synthase subunit beta [Clostridia bacterium]|nr:glutamate synthase subunit beta [Clostridia bacterium]
MKTGFLDIPRAEDPLRDARERVLDFDDLHTRLPDNARSMQAQRCMNCGVPFCQSDFGCPLHNLIPEWNSLLEKGLKREALERLLVTAPFPEFTGHVCPALCEKACNLESHATTNRDNELYLIEEGFRHGWVKPNMPASRTKRRVAVIGSGPAGLACADLLNQLGHKVTVMEASDRPGGLLMWGIPNMKLPKEVVARRIRLMEEEGITFQTSCRADRSVLPQYDAAILCGGARKPRTLPLPHMDAGGIHFAVDYLSEATRALLEKRPSRLSAKGLHVIVVGGGDTGNDCVGTALREKCRDIVQLEMLPKPPGTRTLSNPWPEWPRTLRTDYGQLEAEAIQGQDPRIFETTVSSIGTDEDGHVREVTCVRVAQKDGRLLPQDGAETVLPCDLLLIAAGFTGADAENLSGFSLTPDERGRLMPPGGGHHLRENLFAAGDIRTGQSLVVRAISDGRDAAREVDAWLSSPKAAFPDGEPA